MSGEKDPRGVRRPCDSGSCPASRCGTPRGGCSLGAFALFRDRVTGDRLLSRMHPRAWRGCSRRDALGPAPYGRCSRGDPARRRAIASHVEITLAQALGAERSCGCTASTNASDGSAPVVTAGPPRRRAPSSLNLPDRRTGLVFIDGLLGALRTARITPAARVGWCATRSTALAAQ